jgi:hypothetical protein
MTALSGLRPIGTRTGKASHLTEDQEPTGTAWTLCGRWVKNHTERAESNCQKCIDRRDLAIGKQNHQLSITPVPAEAGWADAPGIKGFCSCSAMRELPAIAKGTDLVNWHEAHVLAEIRKSTTDPRAHPDQNPETCTRCGDGVPFHDAEALRVCGLTKETK